MGLREIHEYNADIKLIEQVTEICKKRGETADLFVLFARTSTPTVYYFVVYGCNNFIKLETDLEQIETLQENRHFDYDSIHNEFYGRIFTNMESRFINRYHTFCKCLNNLEKVKLQPGCRC